jgi:hypothetical protein
MSITAGAPIRGVAMGGHTRISTQALTSVARAAAGEAFGVPAHDVRVEWTDDDGLLALSLVTPAAIPPLTQVLHDPARVEAFGGSIWERALAARPRILGRVVELTGAQLSRVDIRVSGAAVQGRRRVH